MNSLKTIRMFILIDRPVNAGSLQATVYSAFCIRGFLKPKITLVIVKSALPVEEIFRIKQIFCAAESNSVELETVLIDQAVPGDIYLKLLKLIASCEADFFAVLGADEVVFQNSYKILADLIESQQVDIALGKIREAYFSLGHVPFCCGKSKPFPKIYNNAFLLSQNPLGFGNLLFKNSDANREFHLQNLAQEKKFHREFFVTALADKKVALLPAPNLICEKRLYFPESSFQRDMGILFSDKIHYSNIKNSFEEKLGQKVIEVKVADLEEVTTKMLQKEIFFELTEFKLLARLTALTFKFPALRFPLESWVQQTWPRAKVFIQSNKRKLQNVLGLHRALAGFAYIGLYASGFLSEKDMPIFINNRNRLSTLSILVKRLEESGFRNIAILDNDSTYEPLLKFYSQSTYKIYFLKKNSGPLALWNEGHQAALKGFYIYTDSDVIPPALPAKALVRKMIWGFIRHPFAKKVGLALDISDLPDFFTNKEKVISHEKKFWSLPLSSGFFDAPVDTTFAMYAPGQAGGYWVTSIRTALPYVAKHLPWYVDEADLSDEEIFYRKTAAHWSSWGNLI